jgi:iron(III) transport system permease protein
MQVTGTLERPEPPAPPPVAGAPVRPPARRHRPVVLTAVAGAVAVALLLPLAFLALEAVQDGWSALAPLVFRQLTASLLWATVSLTVTVTACCAVIGTLAAWCVERTDLPGRRIWAVLVVVPVGIPDFAVAFGWKSLFAGIGGFGGATLVMTLAVYPLVYLPVAASLRNADPGQEEVARSLGLGRLRTFWRITVGQARLAILGGGVLVALVVLAEYGAFEILGYRTFTTEIFTEFENGFNTPAACGLSVVLVVLSLVVLVGEGASRGRGRMSRVGSLAARMPQRQRLGRATAPTLAAFGLLVVAALGVPVWAVVYWLFQTAGATLPAASLASAAAHSAGYGIAAGAIATVAALPVALLSVRHPSRPAAVLERSTYVVLAVPGLVVALALTYFSERYAGGFLYQSTLLLVLAYAVMFFPLALVAVRASVAQAPVRLEEIGRSLGQGRLAVLWRVTLPLIAPGLAAAFCLVFLEVVTELTATLVLIPTGAQTLATQFWAYQTNLAYHQAAPYAAVMIAVAAIPSYVLGRWFDRLPSRAAVAL